MRFLVFRGLALVTLLVLPACTTTPAPAQQSIVVTPEPGAPVFTPPDQNAADYPAPAQTDDAYPGPQATVVSSSDGRSQSVLQSYEPAHQLARTQLGPEAQLYGVVPSTIVIGNLGGPPVVPGWFYKFKRQGSRREFIVQVVDGQVTGSTTAESIEEPTPAELPIDLSQIKIDSDQVFALFTERAPELGITPGDAVYDLELVSLAGKNGPTWSVVDPTTKKWVFSVNAESGEPAADPHQ
ncbi:MAG TPA: hypothetical protein VLA19_31705 [Herpetosiphonaceae bacterium]|nr:hypothetical protein [Herpetosiphonaceae bacterium]